MQSIHNNISEIQQEKLQEKTELLRSRVELLEGTDREIMTIPGKRNHLQAAG